MDTLLAKKEFLRQKKGNVGHAIQDKQVSLNFLKRVIVRSRIAVGPDLTAEHFFLNRPVKDLKKLLNICHDYIDIDKNCLIFDPGCGTGRHLFFMGDKYNCNGIGVDIYAPAIEVANRANLNDRFKFHNCSSLEAGLLDQILPDGCDYVLINSWLNHVYDYDGYHGFVEQLIDRCRFVLLITSTKYELAELINNPHILLNKVDGGARYALLKGKKTER